MSIHKEISFEDGICDHLAAHGWLYSENDQGYDRGLALFPEDVLAWIQTTQPEAWKAIVASNGASAGQAVITRLRESINLRGTLEVLRHGFDMMGLRKELLMAQFKPALALNADILTRYDANRLRVMRQVHYSTQHENCIDLVLFLNGIPIATVELKTDFTQSIGDAIDQYRFDREPCPKGKSVEPLLSFPQGALVHFAVSNSEVHMTTRLLGPHTQFLPFNLGDNGGAGNPVNPTGHRTAYLWEHIWERHGWLEILGRYVVAKKNAKKQIESVIFPRYHQLDATRKLQAAIRQEGAGGKYLIQHSAGSGKTNSIAWTAHLLADLHDDAQQKVFDSILVVSDRTVIDGQLQDAIFGFERTAGVVAKIKGDSGSKSAELASALSGDKKIVVCTVQTFPFALDAVRELSATKGKRFAVIADEAHSSQSGDTASKLKLVLSDEELKALEDGGEVSTEDILTSQMTTRANIAGVTFVAFTATPKAKTLEHFGTRPDPTRPPSATNIPVPFHVYSMQQAIEERFILDVLENYTSYKLAFKLAFGGKEWTDKEVERNAAMKGIMGWVQLHPYNIARKVQIVVEHFRETVAPLLDGKAKAMIVVGNRIEAVRWQVAITKYIQEHGYAIRSLVAFSGEVNDKETGPDAFTERSSSLNPDLKGRDIRQAFAGDEYQILLVANKFQTGFDQPLLCGMYVDRKLAGIQTVQTLSRLNRAHPGKDKTYILDFENEPAEILAAFKTYYKTAQLSGVTDPNLVLNLKDKLNSLGYYDAFEVDRVVAVELNPNSKQHQLEAAIAPVADRLLKHYKAAVADALAAKTSNNEAAAKEAKERLDALLLFRSDMTTYVRLYTFLSQIFDYGKSEIEKLSIFYRRLIPLLKFGREREGVDLSQLKLTHHHLKDRGKQAMNLGDGPAQPIAPITSLGTGMVREKTKAYLSEIVEKVNDLFGQDTTDGDQLSYVQTLNAKLQESETLRQQAANNSKEQFANSPDLKSEIVSAIIEVLDAHNNLSTQALNSERIRDGLRDILLGPGGLYESLRSNNDAA